MNFPSRKEKDKFLQGIEISSDLPFLEGYSIRKAWIPDPQLIITISSSIWLALTSSQITTKVINNVGDKISEAIANDILKFYELVREAVVGMLKYAVPKNRPQTFVIVLPTSPIIKLIVRNNDPDLIVSSLHSDCLLDVEQKATMWQQTLKAEEVQFKLSNKGQWDLLYLLTEDGAIIGGKSSFPRKATEIKMDHFVNRGVSIGMHEKPNPLKRHNDNGKTS